MNPTVSVIVCTFNRPESLTATIKSLLAQNFCLPFEIIVVDNASTGNALCVIETLQQKTAIPILYVHEPKQGLSRARNRGIRSSGADVVAFIDDDAAADEAWLSGLMKIFSLSDNVVAVGGPVDAMGLKDLPAWFPSRLRSHLSIIRYGEKIMILKYPNYPFGTNMAFRRRIFDEVGYFDSALGRCGTGSFSTGEETDIFLRIESAGGIVCYTPGACVRHAIPPERLTPQWLYHQTYWIGFSGAQSENKCRNSGYLVVKALSSVLAIASGLSCLGVAGVMNERSLNVFSRCVIQNRRGYLKGLVDSQLTS